MGECSYKHSTSRSDFMSFERRDLALTREILARIGINQLHFSSALLRHSATLLLHIWYTFVKHFDYALCSHLLHTFATFFHAFLELVARLDYYYWRFVPNL